LKAAAIQSGTLHLVRIRHFYHGSAMKKTVQTSGTNGRGQQRYSLEVCVASVQDALAASQGGADRLELNGGLEIGGLTPSIGLVTEVLQMIDLPVIAMIRPRGAGFCYDPSEQRVMLRDAESLLRAGVAGIAFGSLTRERDIDQSFCRELMRVAGDRETVFHRAFDTVKDARSAARCLIDLNVTRLLTSGMAKTAIEGAERIANLRSWTHGQLELLPGSGVNASNVQELLRRTGCHQVHGSFSCTTRDEAGIVAPSNYQATNRDGVAAVRRVLDSMEPPEPANTT
jgi:copper homeostasis protein